jgi:RHS repeat-associated protein
MSQTTQATRYVYDGDAIALEFDTTNPMAPALTHRYLRAVDQLFADEQLSAMGPGALYWPLTDYQGSVRELLDASGAVVKQYRYDSFGVRSVVSGSSAVDEFFAYTGQARDPESGLQQHWHRYYDPPTGRWISADWSSFGAGDSNLYRYVSNRPTNATDPSGLESVETWKKKAQEKLVAYPPKTVKDVIENNKKITAFYASLYKLDETAFFWFGMAAYASYKVGQGLADTAKAMKYAPGLEVFGNKTDDIFNILGQGNQAIFLDIAWIAIAYQESGGKDGGMKELEKHKASIDPVAYQGWVELDKAYQEELPGKKLELAMAGSKKIIDREQRVLQGILDMWDKKVVRRLTPALQQVQPLFPGAQWRLDDFGDLRSRLMQIDDVILPSFLDYQHKSADKVKKFIEQRIAEGK